MKILNFNLQKFITIYLFVYFVQYNYIVIKDSNYRKEKKKEKILILLTSQMMILFWNFIFAPIVPNT